MKKFTGSKGRFLFGAFLLVLVITISDGCSKNSLANMYGSNNSGNNTAGTPGTNEVWIQGMAFSPSTISVAAGTTISWTNKDGIAHTVTSNTNIFNSGDIAAGGTFTFTFATAGTYTYHCAIHPGMIANVVVN